MYIFKNAIRNITRSLGRNILIGIIALAIAISSCVALSIKQAAKTAQENRLVNPSITANIGVDMGKIRTEAGDNRDSLRELMKNNGELSLEEMQKYAKSSYVKDFIYTLQSSISGSETFEAYSETEDETETSTSSNNTSLDKEIPKDRAGIGFGRMGQQGDFTILGFNSENAMTDFIDGTNKIVSGKTFAIEGTDNTCLISDTLATFNGLKIGDIITLTNPNQTTETYTLTIIGTYTTTKSTDNSRMRFSTSQDPLNYIYTSYNTLKNITDTSATKATVSTDDNGNETTTSLRSSVSGTYAFSDTNSFESF